MARDDEQAPPLPNSQPFDGSEGMLGIADVGGGYPIEQPVAPRSDKLTAEAGAADNAALGTAAPYGGEPRRLYNPLPMPSAALEEWGNPEPARSDWRKVAPFGAVLAVAIGAGLWLTLSPSWPRDLPSAAPEPTQEEQSIMAEPTRVSPEASRSPRPHTPPTSAPAPRRTRSSARISPSPSLTRPWASPTVTVTRKVTVTVRPSTTSRPSTSPSRAGSPEEPPVGGRPSSTSAPTCRTWADCHDEPPAG